MAGRVADFEVYQERILGLAADRLPLDPEADRAVDQRLLFLLLDVAFERADDV
jgi:hypothetical protein